MSLVMYGTVLLEVLLHASAYNKLVHVASCVDRCVHAGIDRLADTAMLPALDH